MAFTANPFSIANEPVLASELQREDSLYLLFNSIHRVLKVEKILTAAEIPFRLISTPRPLFSDCGLSIVIAAEKFKQACSLFEDHGVKLEHAYVQRGKQFAKLSLDVLGWTP